MANENIETGIKLNRPGTIVRLLFYCKSANRQVYND